MRAVGVEACNEFATRRHFGDCGSAPGWRHALPHGDPQHVGSLLEAAPGPMRFHSRRRLLQSFLGGRTPMFSTAASVHHRGRRTLSVSEGSGIHTDYFHAQTLPLRFSCLPIMWSRCAWCATNFRGPERLACEVAPPPHTNPCGGNAKRVQQHAHAASFPSSLLLWLRCGSSQKTSAATCFDFAFL